MKVELTHLAIEPLPYYYEEDKAYRVTMKWSDNSAYTFLGKDFSNILDRAYKAMTGPNVI